MKKFFMSMNKGSVLGLVVQVGTLALSFAKHALEANERKKLEDELVDRVMERISSKQD